jgi:hypothetical protein
MSKAIEFEIDEIPTEEKVNDKGEYVFGIYTSTGCDDSFTEAMDAITKLWDVNLPMEVCLRINVRLRSVYENAYDMYKAGGKIDKEDWHLFEAMRNDAQWIVDQINSLKMR